MTLDLSRRGAIVGATAAIASVATNAIPLSAREARSYRDASASPQDRAAALLGLMTIEEKAAQLRCGWFGKARVLGKDGNFSAEKAAEALANGWGQFARPSDWAGTSKYLDGYRTIENTVALVNAIQRHLVENTRLGIPALFHEEAQHGYRAIGATIFPSAPALGSTWDPDLVEEVYTVAAREVRLRGGTVALSPVIDLALDPRYGRVEEFYGEDPRHVSRMGVAAVRGLQGRHRPIAKDRVFATLKHFVHGTPQGGLNIAPSDVSDRTMREIFLAPFATAVAEADPAIIMPSYNEAQGIPSHANVALLQETGRRYVGFKGAYFSDYQGISNLMDHHHVAASKEDCAVLAMNAGVQADLPEGDCYALLPQLVQSGRIDEAQIDRAVLQVLALKFEAGLFENPYQDPKRAVRGTNTPAAIALARKTAQKSIVLLTNDGVVPLEPKTPMKLAVIGPNSVEPLFGGYSADNDKAIGILEGLRKGAPAGVSIEQADGVWITAPDKKGRHETYSVPVEEVSPEQNRQRIAEAVELAKRSDVVLLVVGDVPAITREAVTYVKPGDRETLGLYGQQDELIDAITATGKPVVALLLNGRALAVRALKEKANALFEGWYLGEQGGPAFADVLFGRANPGGKLAVSFPKSVGQLPIYYNRHPSADVNRYVEGPHGPLFPFGHGLSYTTFDIAAPRLTSDSIAVGQSVRVEVDVANVGKRTGDEVVQLYVRDDVSSVPRPVLELRHFRRITLDAGEKRTISFDLTSDDLAFWDADMNWAVEPGTFTISAGGSSANLASTKLTVRKAI